MRVSRLAGFGLLLVPVCLQAQRREDFQQIQRDVAQLQEDLKQMKAGQDQKLAVLEGLLKQALEESNRVSNAMTTLQRTLTDRVNEQATKMEGPIAVIGTKVDQSADELRSLRENVANLSMRFGSLDNKLADISSAIRTLSTPQVAPPPAAGGGVGPGTFTAAPGPPAGVSAESLWQNAFRHYSRG